MSTTTISVPDFEFSGFYYAEILRRLRLFNRINAPEITSEIDEEPFIQLERAFSLVGHYNNVLLDLAANELLIPNAKLLESVKLLLRLIDFELRDYSPALVDIYAELTQVFTSSTRLLEANTLFETERDEDEEAIQFENLTALDVTATNIVDAVFSVEKDRSGTDAETIVGEPDMIDSASMSITAADLNSQIEITNSTLGNNQIYEITQIIQTGAVSRIRLASFLGGPDPLFVFETGLSWKISNISDNSNTAVNTAGAPYFTPWTDVEAGDYLYIGSSNIMWDELDFTFQTVGANITGVFEYYDSDLSDEIPDEIVNLGTNLRININPILGTTDRTGAWVKVTYLPTGSFEWLKSNYLLGINYIETSAFLGQSGVPSTTISDYSIGSDWNILEDYTDGTSDLSTDGKIEDYTVPQTLRTKWEKITLNDVEAYYLRYRVISVSTPTNPIIDEIDIDDGKQFILFTGTQGETISNEAVVSSTGLESQEFILSTTPGLKDTVEAYVDEGGGEIEWENITASNKRLITSGTNDRHFMVDQSSTGELTVIFGDGTRGKIPTLGTDNIRFVYRVNADQDGNVGSETVTVNAGGASLIKNITNPRAGYGWREADGVTEDSLALVKEEGPASLRTGNRAIAPQDYEDLALAFETSDGTRPIIRAKAIEEGYGPKTIKLIVVGIDGVSISAETKSELEDYFNGNDSENIKGVGQTNTECTVINFTPRLIPITISVEGNSSINDTLVKTKLSTLLNPSAKIDDGTDFIWSFGGRVPISRITSEIFKISPGNIFDVDITVPSVDIELLEDELPLLDVTSLNVSIIYV